MKKFLLLGTIFVATGALAFGGIGIGPWQRHKNSGGVDAIGVHIDANDNNTTPDITLVDCNGNGVKGVDNNCYCNQGYTGTYCETKLCETGSYCGMDGDNPLCCPSDHICTTAGDVLGTCFRAESGCTTNADCESGEFCKLGMLNCEPTSGTCEPLGESTPSAEVKDADGNIVFSAGLFLIHSDFMYWWAARNWCEAQGKRMLRLSDLNTSLQMNGGDYGENRCDFPCGEDDECQYKSDFDGTTATEQNVCKPLGDSGIMNANDPYYGKLLGYMRQAIGNDWYWIDNEEDSCVAFVVDLDSGSVYNYFRDDGDSYTLCK